MWSTFRCAIVRTSVRRYAFPRYTGSGDSEPLVPIILLLEIVGSIISISHWYQPLIFFDSFSHFYIHIFLCRFVSSKRRLHIHRRVFRAMPNKATVAFGMADVKIAARGNAHLHHLPSRLRGCRPVQRVCPPPALHLPLTFNGQCHLHRPKAVFSTSTEYNRVPLLYRPVLMKE